MHLSRRRALSHLDPTLGPQIFGKRRLYLFGGRRLALLWLARLRALLTLLTWLTLGAFLPLLALLLTSLALLHAVRLVFSLLLAAWLFPPGLSNLLLALVHLLHS